MSDIIDELKRIAECSDDHDSTDALDAIIPVVADELARLRAELAAVRADAERTPWREEITALERRPEDAAAAACSCCGGPPSLWEVDREGTVTKMVNCDRAKLSEGDRPITESCPMYSPGLAFNKATRREAIAYWNMVQARLAELRAAAIDAARGAGGQQ